MPVITRFLTIALAGLCLLYSARPLRAQVDSTWWIGALPSSVRLDPVNGKIIEDRPDIYRMEPLGDLPVRNWVFDGETVELHAARGEYVSFQLVIAKGPEGELDDISVRMQPFSGNGVRLEVEPELFLEWSVEVRTPSSGYERTSYGPGWYPDALIPLDQLQTDPERQGRLWYPLRLPDFRNRIENQRFQVIWVDQFVPFAREAAPPGVYRSEITVRVGGVSRKLPVALEVWDFALPNRNNLAGNLQQGGFMKNLDEDLELELYQLFKRHRIVPFDYAYRPGIEITGSGEVVLDWTGFDSRLRKYFTGEAFTEKYGYSGPGYGEPLEQYVLPFDCYRDHRGITRPGWPDVGDMQQERKPENRAVYISAIRQVREHILSMADPQKTRLIVFQGGLDESYFPEAWDRMVYYGKLFKQYFPEAFYRVDGSYSREAMETIHEAIDYWCCHTVGYDMETVLAYRELGIKDWVYGPLLYERRENSWVGSSTFLDLELTNERLISWACWKYRTLTWCSWGIGCRWEAAWFTPATWQHATREQGSPLRIRTSNGNALGAYAPNIVPSVDVPCSTVRLKNMRDGVEEYELMRLLSGLDGGPDRVDAVVNRIVGRPFGKESIGDIDVWSHDPRQWDAARLELGELAGKASAR
ncbi:MAG: DUF4091 domain-containing protein [Candidatus Glassbacteria bacterium]|nr:DUF4091 domain-containing protein [Candidatus Glassbacteria bacterium]